MPILPFIVEDFGADEWVYGLLMTLYSAFQFIGAPWLGSLSDEKGRKRVLLISHIGTLLSWFVFLGALYAPNIYLLGIGIPIWIIAGSRILDGLTGGNISVANAYTSDLASKDEKKYIFGFLGGISGIGLIVGPGLGGLTAASPWGYTATIWCAIAISTITLISITWKLKESLPPEKRRKREPHNFLYKFLLIRQIRDLKPSKTLKVLFWIKLLYSILSASYMATIALYIIDLFDFDEKEIGGFMLVVGLFLAVNQAVVSKWVIAKVGVFKTLIVGMVLSVIGPFAITMSDDLIIYILFYYLFNLGFSLYYPTMTALVSMHAEDDKQGETMGIFESINSFAMTVFPVLAAAAYGLINYKVYYFMALLPLTALLILMRYRKSIKL